MTKKTPTQKLEENNLKRLFVSIDKQYHHRLRVYSILNDVSVATVICGLIKDHIPELRTPSEGEAPSPESAPESVSEEA